MSSSTDPGWPDERGAATAAPRCLLQAPTRVLGVETSCDETSVGVVDAEGRVEAHVVASQAHLHARWGGVVPEVASREHLQALAPLVGVAERQASGPVDGIAVTTTPGLIGALLVGVRFAAALAYARRLPLVAVDHLQGHLASPLLSSDGGPARSYPTPTLALVASGGHSAWYRIGSGEPERLARTRDDAAGESLDKLARALGLGYPGGPMVDRLARDGDPGAVDFRQPDTGSLDFSFSGLKSAAIREVRRRGLSDVGEAGATQEVRDLLASYQAAVVEQLLAPLASLLDSTGAVAISASGGVAANSRLRARLTDMCDHRGVELLLPELAFTGDNGAMIAWAGVAAFADGRRSDPRRIDGSPRSVWQPPGMRRQLRSHMV